MSQYPANFGLQQEKEVRVKDWRVGGISGISREILRPSGQWLDLLPEKEYQVGIYFDTKACISFASLNCLEILMKFRGIEANKSDRFLAKLSGTTKDGNYLSVVADALRTTGTVPEVMWPYPRLQRDPPFTWEDYYQEIPEPIKAEGKSWLNDWLVNWEWVAPTEDGLLQALTWGPVQVTVYAWPNPVNGLYPDVPSMPRNHAVTLVGYKLGKYWIIFDHYDAVVKHLAWDYKFGAALRFQLTRKNPIPTMPEIANDTLLQLAEAPGGFALYLNGKKIVDDLAKVLASWQVRNGGNTKGKVLAVTKTVWDSVLSMDLKGNLL